MTSGATDALIFIVQTLAQLYLIVLILRLVMPWLGASFHNPVAQAILKLTSPLIVPIRRILPPIGRLDTATMLVAFAIQYLTVLLIAVVRKLPTGILEISVTSAIKLLVLTLNVFVFAIFIRVILSWVNPGGYNPIIALIDSLTEPVLRPFRRLVPSLGGIDLSPIFAIVLLTAAGIFLSSFKMLRI